MKYTSLVTNALNSLTINKLRTFLTVLGIVIGITSVITLINIGQAAQATIESSVSAFGSNLISIVPGNFQTASGFSFDLSASFDFDNVVKLRNSNMQYVSGVSSESSKVLSVQLSNQTDRYSVTGIYGDYFTVRTVELSGGRAISDKDSDSLQKVAIIGPDLVSKYFNSQSEAIGQRIVIADQSFTIIGVTAPRGSNGFQNLDEVILIPLRTMQKTITGDEQVRTILAVAKDPDLVGLAVKELQDDLKVIRGLSSSEDPDFTIRNSGQALSILTQITSIFTVFLATIAGISLVVGGIGIMNIMFVTVKERTKEIGLRKALGATKNDILLQFLAESITVTMLGGLIGTGLGILLTYIFTQVAGVGFAINTSSIVLAVGVSALIGLLFGSYPAWQAAQLDPIVSLRYE
jgi:putative ABC transport system permease protein